MAGRGRGEEGISAVTVEGNRTLRDGRGRPIVVDHKDTKTQMIRQTTINRKGTEGAKGHEQCSCPNGLAAKAGGASENAPPY